MVSSSPGLGRSGRCPASTSAGESADEKWVLCWEALILGAKSDWAVANSHDMKKKVGFSEPFNNR